MLLSGSIHLPEIAAIRSLLIAVLLSTLLISAAVATGLVFGDALLDWMQQEYGSEARKRVEALQRLETERDPLAIALAIEPILDYVAHENPNFFTYRFGIKQGLAMQAGLGELLALVRWAAEKGGTISITPIRHYRLPNGQDVVERSPGQAHTW